MPTSINTMPPLNTPLIGRDSLNGVGYSCELQKPFINHYIWLDGNNPQLIINPPEFWELKEMEPENENDLEVITLK